MSQQQFYQTVALYELSDEYLDELNKQINWILENDNEQLCGIGEDQRQRQG